MLLALVANRENETNARIVRAGGGGWLWVTPAEAVRWLSVGDVALGRLDVLPGLDGIDGGLRSLGSRGSPVPPITGPVVIKPRFGSWGRDVVLCTDLDGVHRQLRALARRDWYAAHGTLVQELVRPRGFDLRILVAGGCVVGAIRRVAAAGEWRTNVALGARREAVIPPQDACRLALASAATAGADLVGVDLLPVDDGWTVLELNGAVDFTEDYSLHEDVFSTVARRLAGVAGHTAPPAFGEPVELWS